MKTIKRVVAKECTAPLNPDTEIREQYIKATTFLLGF